MDNTFEEFNAILSSLSKEQYGPYVRAWHGKKKPGDFKKSITFPDISELLDLSTYKEFESWEEGLTDFDEYLWIYDRIDDNYDDIRRGCRSFMEFRDKMMDFLEDLEEETEKEAEENDKDIGNAEDVRHLYDSLFNGKDRITIPLTGNYSNNFMNEKAKKQNARNFNELAMRVFETVGNKREAEAIKEAIDKDRDYRDYYEDKMYQFFSDPRRKMRIGKILSLYEKKILAKTPEDYLKNVYDNAMTTYSEAAESVKYDDLIAIISRHPYDIAGMSTGRKSWRSCMNIDDGEYKKYVRSTLLNGGLVCYICRKTDTTDLVDSKGVHHKNDKYNIQEPLGRFLIKPYYRDGDEGLDFKNPNFILFCSRNFGNFANMPRSDVQKWLDKNWNSKIEGKKFVFDKDHFYYESVNDYPAIGRR